MDKRDLRDLTYIGDGVYAGYDGYYIWIWSSNGITESKEIAIEPEVFNKLHDMAASHWNMGKTGKIEP
jgi:hypothetical protein